MSILNKFLLKMYKGTPSNVDLLVSTIAFITCQGHVHFLLFMLVGVVSNRLTYLELLKAKQLREELKNLEDEDEGSR